MSTATATKTVKTTKAAKVVDKRAFVLVEERAVPVVTTISLPYDVRDALWDYKETNGHSSYGEALAALLAEQGYEF